MRQYIRDRTVGGTYFLTFNLLNRQETLLTDNIDKVRQAYRLTQKHQPFSLQAMVILPEHIHWLIQLPINDDNYAASKRRLGILPSLLFIKGFYLLG
jgi:putative transposase